MSPDALRHTVATLAYRAAKVVRDVPPGFASYRCGESSRTPGQILAHMGDLFDWALSLARGHEQWLDSQPLEWQAEATRFFLALEAFDRQLASGDVQCSVERLFQGPVADALTHTGQIALLRRMAGYPVRGENYFRAGIAAGRVGREHPAPNREFD